MLCFFFKGDGTNAFAHDWKFDCCFDEFCIESDFDFRALRCTKTWCCRSRSCNVGFKSAGTYIYCNKCPSYKRYFLKGVYRSFKIPGALLKDLLIKGTPLLVNEAMWSGSVTALNQCYSMRGLSVVAAINIMSTISNMFNFVFISLGSAIAIVVGKQLGAGKFEEAKDSAAKLIAFSTFCCAFMSILMILVSGFLLIFIRHPKQSRHLHIHLL